MAEFKVGGKMVCVDDSNIIPYPVINKNRIYIINSMRETPCCKNLLLDIGFSSEIQITHCMSCGDVYRDKSGRWWFRASRFLPLDDFQQVTFTKIIEEVPVGAQ